MIAYFAPGLPGELTYSRIVRSASLVFDGKYPAAAKEFLGSSKRDFGVLLPSFVDTLVSNIPTVSVVTIEEIVQGTLLPAIAPFLGEPTRTVLMDRCLRRASTERMMFAQPCAAVAPGRFLAFCPECIREDVRSRLPPYWRTVHQHPASVACPYHSIVTSKVALKEGEFLNLEMVSHASLNVPSIAATPLQMGIARDLAWLLNREAKSSFGPRILSTALKRLMAQNADFGITHWGSRNRICDKLLQKFSSADLDPLGGRKGRSSLRSLVGSICGGSHPSPFFRFSACLYAMNRSIKDLFSEAECVESPSFSQVTVASARAQLIKFVADCNPPNMRAIIRALPQACKIAREADYRWYKASLPFQKSGAWTKPINSEMKLKLIHYVNEARHRIIANESGGRPTRITVGALIREMEIAGLRGSRFNLSKCSIKLLLRRLPINSLSLKAVLDSDVSFVERRAAWAARSLPKGRQPLALRTFQIRAGIDGPCSRCAKSRQLAEKYCRLWNARGISHSVCAVA